jgi:MFS transporter, FSR family, fosmidomycin resistance protein
LAHSRKKLTVSRKRDGGQFSYDWKEPTSSEEQLMSDSASGETALVVPILPAAPSAKTRTGGTVYPIIAAVSFCHLLNDMMQSMLAAIYPMLKSNFSLSFAQIGLLTFTFQITASFLQPVVGVITDKRPQPYSLAFGMAFTFAGLIGLAFAPSYWLLLLAAGLVGIGSSVFHPESSRIARMASGGRLGLAQSLFQVGGNLGGAVGPLLAAFIVVPRGQGSVAVFSGAALVAMLVLWRVGRWYAAHRKSGGARTVVHVAVDLPRSKVVLALAVLVTLMVSKFVYMASLSSYYTFYLIHKFGLPVAQAQILLFVFLGAVAAGTVLGGPIGDRIGRKYVIWGSILGAVPFTLSLPYAGLAGTVALSVVIGLVLASAFSAIVVFAQELVPGRVGLIAGLFFGVAFGISGSAAAALGLVADAKGIDFVYNVCSFLPLLGLLTVFLPNLSKKTA